MALDLRKLISTGRQVARLVRDVRRASSAGRPGTAPGPHPSPDGGAPSRSRRTPRTTRIPRTSPAQRAAPIPGGGLTGPRAGVGPHGGVLDYPGDFHGTARVDYDPVPGPEAGPGEVVWTWVPFEELDGRGKDRPVLVVGRHGGRLLAVPLTSRHRNNGLRRDDDYIDVGTGSWDARGRASEARVDRVLQVDPRDVRREGGVLGRGLFEQVGRALRDRNGWS